MCQPCITYRTKQEKELTSTNNLPVHREEKPREVCCLHHHLSSLSKDMGLWSKAPACSCLGRQHTPPFPDLGRPAFCTSVPSTVKWGCRCVHFQSAVRTSEVDSMERVGMLALLSLPFLALQKPADPALTHVYTGTCSRSPSKEYGETRGKPGLDV